MAANGVSLVLPDVSSKSKDHMQLLDQLNKILSDLNHQDGSSTNSTEIHKTISGLIDNINASFQHFDVLSGGSSSITTQQMINTQLAMEQFTVTVTALGKLIGSVEKGVSTLMHGQ